MNPLEIEPEILPSLIARLTPRQVEIVSLLAQGYGIGQTASLLSIGRETVKTHIRKMCWKLNVDNRIQLIVIFAMWKATNENAGLH